MTMNTAKPRLPELFVRLQRIRLARLAMRISNLFADFNQTHNRPDRGCNGGAFWCFALITSLH